MWLISARATPPINFRSCGLTPNENQQQNKHAASSHEDTQKKVGRGVRRYYTLIHASAPAWCCWGFFNPQLVPLSGPALNVNRRASSPATQSGRLPRVAFPLPFFYLCRGPRNGTYVCSPAAVFIRRRRRHSSHSADAPAHSLAVCVGRVRLACATVFAPTPGSCHGNAARGGVGSNSAHRGRDERIRSELRPAFRTVNVRFSGRGTVEGARYFRRIKSPASQSRQ